LGAQAVLKLNEFLEFNTGQVVRLIATAKGLLRVKRLTVTA
jgi:hypothetical protein